LSKSPIRHAKNTELGHIVFDLSLSSADMLLVPPLLIASENTVANEALA